MILFYAGRPQTPIAVPAGDGPSVSFCSFPYLLSSLPGGRTSRSVSHEHFSFFGPSFSFLLPCKECSLYTSSLNVGFPCLCFSRSSPLPLFIGPGLSCSLASDPFFLFFLLVPSFYGTQCPLLRLARVFLRFRSGSKSNPLAIEWIRVSLPLDPFRTRRFTFFFFFFRLWSVTITVFFFFFRIRGKFVFRHSAFSPFPLAR